MFVVRAGVVEHHLGAEAGSSDSEAGVAEHVGNLATVGLAPDGFNRVEVSIAPPQVWLKRTPSSCGKVAKK